MIIGREKELVKLDRLYADHHFHLAAVYGRHHIGKSTILTEFSHKKNVLYFSALETSECQNTQLLYDLLKNYNIPATRSLTSSSSIKDLLKALFEYSLQDHFALIIDNYHFLTKSVRNLPLLIEELVLSYQEGSKMLLIFSCSSMPIAEKEFLSSKSPYSRISFEPIHVGPLDFFECRKFFRSTSSIDLAYIYGMVGGVPDYLLMMNERISLEENIKNTFLNPSSRIYKEPNILLQREVREPALYNAILCAIANGAGKLSEIAAIIQEETSVCAAYLKVLMLLEIVQKETPMMETSSKKTIYRISDPLFRFWYRFLPALLSDIDQKKTDTALKLIRKGLTSYMEEVFEEICKQYLISLEESGKTPFSFTRLGRWWGTDPFTKERLQIPILAYDGQSSMLFAFCKWSSEKMDLPELTRLIELSEFISCQKRHYYLFSKNGFTRNCQEAAEQYPNVTLVSFSK